MSIDLDLSLDTPIGWKRKPHAIVEDLLGVKPDPWQQEALEAFPHTHVAPCDMDRLTAAPRKAFRERVRARLSQL
jgi:hypothetical protein